MLGKFISDLDDHRRPVLASAHVDLPFATILIGILDGVGDGLEHSRHVKLRHIHPATLGTRVGGYLHVLAHEGTGGAYLLIERACDVLCVPLVRPLAGWHHVRARIGHRLHDGAGQVTLRVAAAHQQARHRWAPDVLVVLRCHRQLGHQNFRRVCTLSGRETPPQTLIQLGERRTRHRCFVEADQA